MLFSATNFHSGNTGYLNIRLGINIIKQGTRTNFQTRKRKETLGRIHKNEQLLDLALTGLLLESSQL